MKPRVYGLSRTASDARGLPARGSPPTARLARAGAELDWRAGLGVCGVVAGAALELDPTMSLRAASSAGEGSGVDVGASTLSGAGEGGASAGAGGKSSTRVAGAGSAGTSAVSRRGCSAAAGVDAGVSKPTTADRGGADDGDRAPSSHRDGALRARAARDRAAPPPPPLAGRSTRSTRAATPAVGSRAAAGRSASSTRAATPAVDSGRRAPA